MLKRIVLFLILNFAALGIGGIFTNSGVSSQWYMELDKAPWTPEGWVFGAAWTLIMICFAVYMAFLTTGMVTKKIVILYSIQWVLNVLWNPIFFYYQHVALALVVISSLTLLVVYLSYNYFESLKTKSILLAPYLIWLIIATSLNAYIFFNN